MYSIKRGAKEELSLYLPTGRIVNGFDYTEMVSWVGSAFSGTGLSHTTLAYVLSLSGFELCKDGAKVECAAVDRDSGELDNWVSNNYVALVNFSPALKTILMQRGFRTLGGFRDISRAELMKKHGLNQAQCDELEIRLALYRIQLKYRSKKRKGGKRIN